MPYCFNRILRVQVRSVYGELDGEINDNDYQFRAQALPCLSDGRYIVFGSPVRLASYLAYGSIAEAETNYKWHCNSGRSSHPISSAHLPEHSDLRMCKFQSMSEAVAGKDKLASQHALSLPKLVAAVTENRI